ncbi:hypothetical protein QW180_22215 [Vibrio sinaloensis]|nr:hypothetical protein [Vibrio sinaloensis]
MFQKLNQGGEMANQQQYAFNWDDLKVFLAIARQGTLRGGQRVSTSIIRL